MEHRQESHRVSELMERLGISAQQLQNLKLGPGVVGRNSSIAWIFLIVMLAGVVASAIRDSKALLALSLGGAILVVVVIVVCNVYFGNKNPAAALLEGAQFVQYHQIMQMAAKGQETIEPSGPAILAPTSPKELPKSQPDTTEPTA